jgi:acetyl-CoA synthetase
MTNTPILTQGLQETPLLPPTHYGQHLTIKSLSDYETKWQQSITNPESYWSERARDLLTFDKPWDQLLDWQVPFARWFVGATLNVSVNCLDRHLANRSNKTALIWEGEPGDIKRYSFLDLHEAVCRCANALENLGARSGDRITIYMPMIPEAVISMLACARIGATHNVVFAGFSAEALAERNNDCQAKFLLTADGHYRKGEQLALKKQVDDALQKSPSIEKTLVVKRTGQDTSMKAGRDHWWHEAMEKVSPQHQALSFSAEHPLFLLYTSGSTGKPKGILHTSAGYLLGACSTFKDVFDHRPGDLFWCTADIGWITGHSYVVYGPLAAGASILIYEGAPMHPNPKRTWEIIDRHKVSVFYTAPTAIRAFMKQGSEAPDSCNLASLRLLGSVGEPINPAAWHWYYETIGKKQCPVVDTWWQTETGSIMIAPLPGVTPMIPGFATRPLLGIEPEIVDETGKPVPPGQSGYLVIKKPWPSMLRNIYQDPDRYQAQYWQRFPGMYFTGDGARRDEYGNICILGRVDDVINVSGHRLSTMEVESALVSHPLVAEAACVGKPDELTGEAIHAFVTLKGHAKGDLQLSHLLQDHVSQKIGKLAKPKVIDFVQTLPKTRSGKIMRRLLRDVAAGRALSGDTSTLEDLQSLLSLQENSQET